MLRNTAVALFAMWLWPAGIPAAAETHLGAPLQIEKPVAIATVLARADEYVGRRIQVRGKVTAVCERMGCWMKLADEKGNSLRVKVEDGKIVFPKTAVGKTAIAEGELEKIERTHEQALARARHHAEEQGRDFDPSSIQGPVTLYQIRGSGAVILD